MSESSTAPQQVIGKAIQDLTRMKIAYDQLKSLHSKLLIAHKERGDELENLQIVVANFRAQYPGIAEVNVPQLTGIVEAVDPEDRIVVLSIGSDQGVKEGYQFGVSRGGEYIGKVRVIQVYDDLSGAEVVYTRDQQRIEVGDSANTVYIY